MDIENVVLKVTMKDDSGNIHHIGTKFEKPFPTFITEEIREQLKTGVPGTLELFRKTGTPVSVKEAVPTEGPKLNELESSLKQCIEANEKGSTALDEARKDLEDLQKSYSEKESSLLDTIEVLQFDSKHLHSKKLDELQGMFDICNEERKNLLEDYEKLKEEEKSLQEMNEQLVERNTKLEEDLKQATKLKERSKGRASA